MPTLAERRRPGTTLDLDTRRAVSAAACSETYFDVEALLHQCCHKFAARYGRDLWTHDELLSVAHAAYMNAYLRFNPDSTQSFVPYCKRVVTHALLDQLRNYLVRGKRTRYVGTAVDVPQDAQEHGEFRFVDLLDDLSPDARYVAQLALETPASLARLVRTAKAGGGTGVRKVLREYLLGMDWPRDRVTACFEEITAALTPGC